MSRTIRKKISVRSGIVSACLILAAAPGAGLAVEKPFWDQEVEFTVLVGGDGYAQAPSLAAFKNQLQTRFRQVVTQMVMHEFVTKDQAQHKLNLTEKQRQEVIRNLSQGVSAKDLPESLKASLNADAIKAYDDLYKEGEIKSYLMVKEIIGKLEARVYDREQTRQAVQIVNEVSEALKTQGRVMIAEFIRNAVTAALKERVVPKRSPIGSEAKNLVDPRTGKMMNADELAAYQQRGGDLSLLEPAGNSSFWRERDIQGVDVEKDYGGEESPLYSGTDYAFPEVNAADFKSVRKSQSKPKLNLTFKDAKGKKRDIKIKFSTETHSEPTASRLATMLGFYSDLSRHVSGFRINLGKKTYEQFKQEVYSYYSDVDVDKYKSEVGHDQEGNYVVLAQALIEPKVKGPVRVGPWSYGAHKDLRELRALHFFNIWVANGDIKERENNKLILKEDPSGLPRPFHMQHDMGFAFGDSLREMPGKFPWHVVKKDSEKEIEFAYKCIQKNSGFEHLTFADGRWFTRKLAKLSRAQIQQAVDAGGWPEAMNQLLVEKLISRRNDFVKAFDLEKEIPLLPVNEKVTSADGTVLNGEVVKPAVYPGFPQNFHQGLLGYTRPLLESIREKIVGAGAGFLSKAKHIDLTENLWEVDALGVAEMNFNLVRDIENNPEAATDAEHYVVKDKFTIGARLSPSVVVGGVINYLRTYTLVYTRETEKEATYNNHFIYNVMLPYQVAAQSLPAKHVLIVEDSIEGGGMLKADGYSPLALGTEGTATRVLLNRTIVSAKDDALVRVYQDRSVYNEQANKIYSRLLVLKLNFTKAAHSEGHINREVLVVPKLSPALALRALDGAIHSGEFAALAGAPGVSKEAVSSEFEAKVHRWTVLGFVGAKSNFRSDKITQLVNGQTQGKFQVQSARNQYWHFLENGENFENKVWLTTRMDPMTQKIQPPAIRMTYKVEDNNAWTGELQTGYLKFAGEVANDPGFLQFTPSLHSLNRRWGKIISVVNVAYSPEAVQKLLRLNPDRLIEEIKANKSDNTVLAKVKRDNFIASLKALREVKDENTKYTRLVKVLRNLVWKDGPADVQHFKGHILGRLNRALGEGNYFVSALLTVEPDKENKFPGGVPYYMEKGKLPEDLTSMSIFDGESDPIELYYGL